jgi:hypothetical protein
MLYFSYAALNSGTKVYNIGFELCGSFFVLVLLNNGIKVFDIAMDDPELVDELDSFYNLLEYA